ncbi:hypothetical protein AWB75_07053 [Caballeronia catudaia]|uniref:Uncharacterized protein n=1 Tax=Caballeronia catudaia TaxID=1777136 RepID=A0A158DQK1_9BURK|nr:hypothetical protein [Caballeronia catudaia]SAK96845.1 hypothetical protein AWB75_07053 [Caballeronia catudaia]
MGKRFGLDTPVSDRAAIELDGLIALLQLLGTEEVSGSFSQLDTVTQVAIFGALEDIARSAHTVIVEGAEVSHG